MSNQSFNNSLPSDQAFTGIENRNFLSPIGFKFNIGKMKGVDFFCQAAAIPAMKADTAMQGTRFNSILNQKTNWTMTSKDPFDWREYEELLSGLWLMRTITNPVKDSEFTYDRGDIDATISANQPDHQSGWTNQWKSDALLFF